MRGSLVSSVVAAFVAITLAMATSAHAQTSRRASDPRTAAAESFREAQAAFARRDFAAAAAAFEQTARTVPHAATWLNAAEAWEKRGEWARAAEDCDRALEVRDVEPEIRREAERRLARAVTRASTLEVRGPRGVGVRIDGDAVQTLPIKRRLAPGAHRVVVVELATERETARDLVLTAGTVETIDIPAITPDAPLDASADRGAPIVPQPSKDPSAGPSPGPPTSSWIAFGVGGAFAVTAGILGVVTLDAKTAYERDPTHATLDTFRRDRVVTNIAIGGAVVAAAVGAVVWVVSASRRAPSTVAADLSPGTLLVF